jgi:hypothetical protein
MEDDAISAPNFNLHTKIIFKIFNNLFMCHLSVLRQILMDNVYKFGQACSEVIFRLVFSHVSGMFLMYFYTDITISLKSRARI